LAVWICKRRGAKDPLLQNIYFVLFGVKALREARASPEVCKRFSEARIPAIPTLDKYHVEIQAVEGLWWR
jgi:hypothetical protein